MEEFRATEGLNPKNDLFNTMYKKYYSPIRSFISKRLRAHQPGDELTQEVFIKLYQNIESLQTDKIKGWLYTVAHNETINHNKKNSLNISSLEEQLVEPSCEDTANKSLERNFQRAMVKNILVRLPKNQAVALYLKDIYGYSYQEIADKMNISYKAVKSLIFRGRQRFIKYYEEMNMDDL